MTKRTNGNARIPSGPELARFFEHAERQARPLRLSLWGRARLANTFKWKLIEAGLERDRIDQLTQTLLLRLSAPSDADPVQQPASDPDKNSAPQTETRDSRTTMRMRLRVAQQQLLQAEQHLSSGEMADAARCFEDVVRVEPLNIAALNSYGLVLGQLGRYREAEVQFRRAVDLEFRSPEGHCNLGNLLRWTGRLSESEQSLRCALRLRAQYPEARVGLGSTLFLLGRVNEARDCFRKAFRLAPDHIDALIGIAAIAEAEGCFDEAERHLKRVIEVAPRTAGAWSALAGLRRMSRTDKEWLKSAEALASSTNSAHDEAKLRFAIGKYHDDLGDFDQAFRSYQRANKLHKLAAQAYDRDERERFVTDMTRVYTREALAACASVCESQQPIFVVGMMRSGTSLIEQILASHPQVRGAGEVPFWVDTARRQDAQLRRAAFSASSRRKRAESYLRELDARTGQAERIVDKAPLNSDLLGLVHSVFPRAKMIYMQRDPIDTCLSCYFQQLSPALNFTMELADLAHYYREHQRMMAHWRDVLPRGTLLELAYADLVADPERWVRAMLEFLGLTWDERCLSFQHTSRAVFTASYWQVRQPLYQHAVGRWRSYRRHLGPLLPLARE